jgi:hypothetical protein
MFGLPSGYKNSRRQYHLRFISTKIFMEQGNTKEKNSKLVFTICTFAGKKVVSAESPHSDGYAG